MFVREIKVSNFMIHRSTDVALFPLTVFVGPNNSGKSSLFDALLKLSAVCVDSIPDTFPSGPYSYRSRHHNGAGADEPIRFDVVFAASPEDSNELRYEIAYRQVSWDAGRATYEITHEHLVERPSGLVLYDRLSDEISAVAIREFLSPQTSFFAALRKAYFERQIRTPGLAGHVSVNISKFGKFRLDPSILGRPGPLPETLAPAGVRLPPRRMGYLGEELASVLYFLSRTRDPSLELIIEGVRSAIDGFAGFEFNAVGNDLVGLSARFDDSRGVVEAPNLSAGTLSLIGWLTLLYRADRQPVVMLEEPELGLTPRSTKAIYDAMRAASASTDATRTQLLVSSHSPRILNWASLDYGNDSVYVLRAGAGAAEIATYASTLEVPGYGVDLNRAMGVDLANQMMDGF